MELVYYLLVFLSTTAVHINAGRKPERKPPPYSKVKVECKYKSKVYKFGDDIPVPDLPCKICTCNRRLNGNVDTKDCPKVVCPESIFKEMKCKKEDPKPGFCCPSWVCSEGQSSFTTTPRPSHSTTNPPYTTRPTPQPTRAPLDNDQKPSSAYHREFCETSRDPGDSSCSGGVSAKKYYFSKTVQKCMEFRYNGCGGNRNMFPSKVSCMMSCFTKPSFFEWAQYK